MKYNPRKRKSTKEAHENMTFMNSREARWLRVLGVDGNRSKNEKNGCA